jgi:hypothetical protein
MAGSNSPVAHRQRTTIADPQVQEECGFCTISDDCVDSSECTSVDGTAFVEGRGRFGLRCAATGADESEPAATEPADGVEDTCVGKSHLNGERCQCDTAGLLANCHTCDHYSTPAAAVCTLCKNGMFLANDGTCISERMCVDVAAGQPVGKGLFGRICNVAATGGSDTGLEGGTELCTGKTAASGSSCWCGGSCHQCFVSAEDARSNIRCTMCKHGAALYEDRCITKDQCLAGDGTISGSGNFGVECRR